MKLQFLLLTAGVGMLALGFTSLIQPDSGKGADKKLVGVAAKLFARATPDDYMNEEACAECHSGIAKNFPASAHSKLTQDESLPLDKQGCQGCHGPGRIHQAEENAEVISYTKLSAAESSAACLRCHEKTMSPNHWKRSEHARADVGCVSCHQIHTDTEKGLGHGALKKDARTLVFAAKTDPKAMLKADEATLCGSCHPAALAEFRGASHHPVPEGKMNCSDCHTPHPSKNSKVNSDPMKGKCVTCHSEKAGPFIHEHDPVAGFTGSGCQECHKPHGTNNAKMLNSTTRGLCGQCHTDKMVGHYPGQTCWSAGCHVSNHGSNSDPRFLKP